MICYWSFIKFSLLRTDDNFHQLGILINSLASEHVHLKYLLTGQTGVAGLIVVLAVDLVPAHVRDPVNNVSTVM